MSAAPDNWVVTDHVLHVEYLRSDSSRSGRYKKVVQAGGSHVCGPLL